jgi:hypothetical protein
LWRLTNTRHTAPPFHKTSRYNELGEDGWELVSVYLENERETAWFKRRKASKFIRRER